MNRATLYYESLLLLCRQCDYETRDRVVTAEEQRKDLDKLIGDARVRNGYAGLPRLDETRNKLRELYEKIVPPAIGKKGTAQAVGAFVSPLLDPKSRGFTEIFDKIKDPPNWVGAAREGVGEALDAANAWLETPRGQERLHATGAPAKWMRHARINAPEWPKAFVEDLDKKIEEARGTPALMQDLREAGVLPLFPPFFASRITDHSGAVSTWDRLAMRLTVGHLLAWESWMAKAAKEHAERHARLDKFRSATLVGKMAGIVAALRDYETERTTELRQKTSLEAEKVRVTPRSIRSWNDLRNK